MGNSLKRKWSMSIFSYLCDTLGERCVNILDSKGRCLCNLSIRGKDLRGTPTGRDFRYIRFERTDGEHLRLNIRKTEFVRTAVTHALLLSDNDFAKLSYMDMLRDNRVTIPNGACS